MLLLAIGLLSAACSGVPKDAKHVTVSLDKIDCADCGEEIVTDLRGRPGVYDAKFDKRAAEVQVVASPEFDVLGTVKQLAANQGFEAVLGEGKGKYLAHAPFPEGSDAQTVVEDGRDVKDLASLAVKGKTTIVDFSGIWCRPCRKIDEHMVTVLAARKDVAYRRLDIGDWDSPLAKHYLAAIPQLPYVVVYGPKGDKVDEIVGVDLPRLDKAIAKAAE
jgi:thiol-disulfide isomerase/thioredoxin